MIEIDPIADRAAAAEAHARVCRLDGSEVPVRLTLLGYECCSFECDAQVALGEPVDIHLHRMGWIRARITAVRPPMAEAEFAKECPV